MSCGLLKSIPLGLEMFGIIEMLAGTVAETVGQVVSQSGLGDDSRDGCDKSKSPGMSDIIIEPKEERAKDANSCRL